MPASPTMPTTCPWPSAADASRPRRSSSSRPRPTKRASRRPASSAAALEAVEAIDRAAPGPGRAGGTRSKRRSRNGRRRLGHHVGRARPARRGALEIVPSSPLALELEPDLRGAARLPDQELRRRGCPTRTVIRAAWPSAASRSPALRIASAACAARRRASSTGSSPKLRDDPGGRQLLDPAAEAPRPSRRAPRSARPGTSRSSSGCGPSITAAEERHAPLLPADAREPRESCSDGAAPGRRGGLGGDGPGGRASGRGRPGGGRARDGARASRSGSGCVSREMPSRARRARDVPAASASSAWRSGSRSTAVASSAPRPLGAGGPASRVGAVGGASPGVAAVTTGASPSSATRSMVFSARGRCRATDRRGARRARPAPRRLGRQPVLGARPREEVLGEEHDVVPRAPGGEAAGGSGPPAGDRGPRGTGRATAASEVHVGRGDDPDVDAARSASRRAAAPRAPRGP